MTDVNLNKYKNEKTFKTSNFNLAVFLIAKEKPIIDIEKGSNNRAVFIFDSTPELANLVKIFNYSTEGEEELYVDVRKLFTVIKQVKGALYS